MADDTSSPLVFRDRFASSRLAEAEQYMAETYTTDMRLRLPTGRDPFAYQQDMFDTGSLAVSRIQSFSGYEALSPGYGARMTGLHGVLAVAHVRAGVMSWLTDRYDELRLRPGDIGLNPLAEKYAAELGEVDLDVVSLDGADLAEYAAQTCGLPSEDVAFADLSPISSARARYWNATVAHVRNDVLGNPAAATSPILIDNAFNMLAAALLSTFPNTALAAVTESEARRPRGEVPAAVLREATDYLDAHAHRPIRATEISDLAGVPAREVVEGLRRHYNTSPSRLLREARLRGVHRDLRDADPLTGPTVAAVAVRWGFTHPGPFLGAYEEMFDEHPEDTLRC